MSDDKTRLREYLAYYGSDINAWPEDAKTWWLKVHLYADLTALMEEEKRFERLLFKRQIADSVPDLAARIIATSRMRTQTDPWVSTLLAEVRPAALAAMLVLGFAIGFNIITPQHSKNSTVVQSTADDEGTIL